MLNNLCSQSSEAFITCFSLKLFLASSMRIKIILSNEPKVEIFEFKLLKKTYGTGRKLRNRHHNK